MAEEQTTPVVADPTPESAPAPVEPAVEPAVAPEPVEPASDPTPVVPETTDPAPVETPAEPQAPAPGTSVTVSFKGQPSPTSEAMEQTYIAVDAADAALVSEVVSWTHNLRTSLLHEHADMVHIEATDRQGPRIEQVLGR